jgi:coenzyme F420-0:L-glutamate ligase/coenzyme F420-1:gamma-L-glutamate ligase
VFTVTALAGIPEIKAGDDLGQVIRDAISTSSITVDDGDILVVTSKIVSKAEGRSVNAADREDAITSQTVRVVATRGNTRIVENPLGLVLAAAGVDSSNTPDGTVLLLPEDPDKSAQQIRTAFSKNIGVIISDTVGRPWRQGLVDIAIGAAGIHVLDDLRGTTDADGKLLEATIVAIADEIASAADLAKGKTSGMPVAIVRGLEQYVGGDDSARKLIRPEGEDMFRLGTREAWDEGYEAGLNAH